MKTKFWLVDFSNNVNEHTSIRPIGRIVSVHRSLEAAQKNAAKIGATGNTHMIASSGLNARKRVGDLITKSSVAYLYGLTTEVKLDAITRVYGVVNRLKREKAELLARYGQEREDPELWDQAEITLWEVREIRAKLVHVEEKLRKIEDFLNR